LLKRSFPARRLASSDLTGLVIVLKLAGTSQGLAFCPKEVKEIPKTNRIPINTICFKFFITLKF
jgi:hypothetical protein